VGEALFTPCDVLTQRRKDSKEELKIKNHLAVFVPLRETST
jgi:hypothetical protein